MSSSEDVPAPVELPDVIQKLEESEKSEKREKSEKSEEIEDKKKSVTSTKQNHFTTGRSSPRVSRRGTANSQDESQVNSK